MLVSFTLLTPTNPTPNGHLHALDHTGNSVAGFPKVLRSTVSATTPAIADLDGTGHTGFDATILTTLSSREYFFPQTQSAGN